MQKQLIDALARAGERPLRAVIGLDGFVDEIVHVVDKRYSPIRFDRLRTLKEYGERIAAAAGLSTNMEFITVARKQGGNGPIMALGLKRFGAEVTYIGAVGGQTVDAVFAELAQGSRMVGVCEPGHTDAMEFEDGKLICCKLDTLNRMTWENIRERLPESEFAALLDETRLISFNNWTMLPSMSDIWLRLLQDVLPLMRAPKEEKTLFFDLADPQKRDAADLEEALLLIRRFKAAGFRTALGLNKKEACEIAAVAGCSFSSIAEAELQELTRQIARLMNVDCVVVHPTDSAACVLDGQYTAVQGPYCAKPRLTTGAGDNFNAGFAYGLVMGFDAALCLTLGTAASGFYVREGRSPSLAEMRDFLEKWSRGALDS